MNDMRIVIIILLVVGYFAHQEGLFDEFIAEVNLASKEISDMDCKEDVTPMAQGKSLQNLLGGTFEIVKVQNAKEQSKSNTEIICIGDAMFSNGNRSKLSMKVFKVGDDFMYEFRQL